MSRGVPFTVAFRPTEPMRERLDRFVQPWQRAHISFVMKRIDTVEGFASLLDRGLEACVTLDKRLDLIQLADWITNEMEQHQLGSRVSQNLSPVYRAQREKMLERLAKTIDRGFDTCCKSDGTLELCKLAAFVIDTMKVEA